MSLLSDPLIMTWYVDGGGNKISIIRENLTHVVTNGRFLLDYIPDEFYKITVNSPSSMVEIDLDASISASTEYKVDYTIGMVYVDSSLEGSTFDVTYYSRGVISYPASRIYTEELNGTVTETLQEKIDYLLTVGGDYDSAETTRVSNENTRISNEDTRMSNENTRIANENTRIAEFNEFEHKGTYDSATTYEKFNIVDYNGSSYMAIQTALNKLPTHALYWKTIAINGSSFTPRGIYDNGTLYTQYDIVTYQNGIYMAKGDTTGNVPTNNTYWETYLVLDALDTLYQDVIADTTVETIYSGTELTTVTWKDAITTNVIRTDTYTYASDSSTETITELRTLAVGGETLEIVSVFDLDGNFISGTSTSSV